MRHAASIAAAQAGATALQIEPTQLVGGLSTSSNVKAEIENMLKWTLGSIALEFHERLVNYYGTGKREIHFESSVAETGDAVRSW